MSAGTPIVRFRGVSKTFSTRSGEVNAVDDVTLDVLEGEIFGVIGYSGAGKSTLVRLINALELATDGTIEVDGREITGLSEGNLRSVRAGIGMIFQQFNLLSSRTVAGNVAYALEVGGWPRVKRQARVAELLEFVGISDKARQYPGQLSGGQKQRVGIARALATNPRILLADEATSALDPETTQDVLALLRKVNQDLGITVVVITHEMDVVKSVCDRVAVMERGKVVELGDVYSVFSAPQHRATRTFVGSSIKDRPTADVLDRLRHRHPGRLVTVSVHEDGTSGGRITDVLAEHHIQGTIVFGGISEVAERPFGSLTWELEGAPDDVDRAVTRLQGYTRVVDLGTADQPLDDPDTGSAPPPDTGGDTEDPVPALTKDAENAAQVGGLSSFNLFAPFRRGNR
jgi:D-methionine transport system ATP-binding protein